MLASNRLPAGPAATPTSTPSVSLPFPLRNRSSPFWVWKTSTRSVDWAPAWAPKLPPNRWMKTGLLQVPSGCRTDSTPRPNRAPKMKLILNMSGMMAMPCACFITRRGIPVLGLRVISLRTSSDFPTVASGSFWARAGGTSPAETPRARPAMSVRVDDLMMS